MLQDWLILFPELALLGFLLAAWLINRYRTVNTPKTFFTLSKYFLLAAILGTVVFYNKSAFPGLWVNTPYSTLFKIVIYLLALAWYYLSSKWFLAKNKSSYQFYNLVMLALLALELLISAASLLLPLVLMPLLCWINWRLLRLYTDPDEIRVMSRLYAFLSWLFILLLAGGIVLIGSRAGTFDCAGVFAYFQNRGALALADYAAVGMILASLLFMLAIAPFHSWYLGMLTYAILPVCGFLTLIPPFAHLSCLINLITNVFGEAGGFMRLVLIIFAAFSLFVGALSANGAANIRRLFGFSSVYHLGFMLFSIVSFNHGGMLSAFAYMMIYLLAMAGVYTVFLGLKSRGDFLADLEDIDGLSNAKPYLAAAFLIFMISLTGTPPLLGFLGRLSVINNLVVDERWVSVGVLLLSILFMANAYLQVIRTIYFEPVKHNFDRTDKAIYICLFINLILVMISIINPTYLLQDAEKILSGVF